jgi:hypothetical protein
MKYTKENPLRVVTYIARYFYELGKIRNEKLLK